MAWMAGGALVQHHHLGILQGDGRGRAAVALQEQRHFPENGHGLEHREDLLAAVHVAGNLHLALDKKVGFVALAALAEDDVVLEHGALQKRALAHPLHDHGAVAATRLWHGDTCALRLQ
jgi:hypothetical protein